MVIAHAGGLWVCDQTLIAMLHCYQDQSEITLLDSQNIPRKIDPGLLIIKVKQRHQEIMNAWLIAYAELAKVRTAKDV